MMQDFYCELSASGRVDDDHELGASDSHLLDRLTYFEIIQSIKAVEIPNSNQNLAVRENRDL